MHACMSSHLLSHGLFKAFKVSPLFLIACVGTVTVGPVVDCNSLDPENQCPTRPRARIAVRPGIPTR